MNKKKLIGLAGLGVAAVGIGAIVGGVFWFKKGNDKPGTENPKPVKPTLTVSENKTTEASISLNNLVNYKNQTLQVYQKEETITSYPTTASQTLTVNDKGEKLIFKLSGLVANKKYDIKVTTTATEGKAAVEVATLRFSTLSDEVVKPTPSDPVAVEFTIKSIGTDKATIKFAKLDSYVGKKVYLNYWQSAVAVMPETTVKTSASSSSVNVVQKSSVLTVGSEKEVEFSLTSLSSDTEYSFKLMQEAEGEVAAKEILKSDSAKFKTYANSEVLTVSSASGIYIEVKGLQEYEGQDLVVTLYKKATVSPSSPATASPAPSSPATASAKIVSSDSPVAPVAPTAPTQSTTSSTYSVVGNVKDSILKLTIPNVVEGSTFELSVTSQKEGDNVLVKQEVKTLSYATIEQEQIFSNAIRLKVKNISDYKNKKLVIKYALVENHQTKAEALNSKEAKTLVFDSGETGADVSQTVTGLLSNNKKYAYQLYLEEVAEAPLLSTIGEFNTKKHIQLKTGVENPKLNSQGQAEITFTNVNEFKGKILELKVIPLAEEFKDSKTTKSNEQTIAADADQNATTKFTITSLDSETQYKYQLFIKDDVSVQPLLANDGHFTSLKTAVAVVSKVTNKWLEISVSKLDNYIGKTIELQYKKNEEATTTWTKHSESISISSSNRNSALFRLTSTELTNSLNKGYVFKIVIKRDDDSSASEEIVLPQQSVVLGFPVALATPSSNSFKLNLINPDLLSGKMLVLQYKKKTDENWITGPEQEVKKNSEGNYNDLWFSFTGLDSSTTYEYKLFVKDSYDVIEKAEFTTWAKPVIGTKSVKHNEFTVTVSNLNDYINTTLIVKYRKKDSVDSWTTSGTELSITNSNSTNEQSVIINDSIEANTSYDYYVSIKDQEMRLSDTNAVTTLAAPSVTPAAPSTVS